MCYPAVMKIHRFLTPVFISTALLGLTITATRASGIASSGSAIRALSLGVEGLSAAAPVSSVDKAAASDTLTYLRRLEKLGFAGMVLVARGSTPLFVDGFGLADRERNIRWTPGTVSDIGSITKQFTAAAILKLEEDGKLSVTDPISRYLPDAPADKSRITLHQLLSHSSGLTDPDIDDYDPVPFPEYLRRVFGTPLRFKPGEGYSYENANFSLLGAIVEKLSGQSYEAFIRERLFLPNGMFETGYQLPLWGDLRSGRFAQGYQAGKPWGTILERPMAADGPHWALRANGGIHMTAYDMLRWCRALLEGRVLGPGSMKKLWSPYSNEGGGSFYGYGWSIAKAPDGTKIVTHNGGNGIFFADLAVAPDTGLVVFLMTNVISENRSANSLLKQLGMRFSAGEAYPAIPEVVDLGEAGLAAFPGTYDLESGATDTGIRPSAGEGTRGSDSLLIAREGAALFIEAQGARAFALLNSTREADPQRLDRLSRLTDQFVAANLKGDFAPLFKAYGGKVSVARLKAGWDDLYRTNENQRGKLLRFKVLGTARTEVRYETVVRFISEKGSIEITYVWDAEVEGRLLGRSVRGLQARLRLYPSGERDFFTWDGGERPPKPVHFERGADGKMRVRIRR